MRQSLRLIRSYCSFSKSAISITAPRQLSDKVSGQGDAETHVLTWPTDRFRYESKSVRLLIAVLLSSAIPAQAAAFELFRSTDNQESCIIDALQGVNNRTAAHIAVTRCKEKYKPYRIVGSRYPLGRTGSKQSCIAEYGSSTENDYIARLIYRACAGVNMRSLRDVCAELEPPKPQERKDSANTINAFQPHGSALFADLPSPQQVYEAQLHECRSAGYL